MDGATGGAEIKQDNISVYIDQPRIQWDLMPN